MTFRLKMRPFAKGRKLSTDGNKLEEAYNDHLLLLLAAKKIVWFKYKPGSLCLTTHDGKSVHYRPDFMVMAMDGTLEIHETKGRWEEDAIRIFKIAADTFPFRFLCVKGNYNRRLKTYDSFTFQDFSGGADES